jgi:phosphate transport system substrate-binding protein
MRSRDCPKSFRPSSQLIKLVAAVSMVVVFLAAFSLVACSPATTPAPTGDQTTITLDTTGQGVTVKSITTSQSASQGAETATSTTTAPNIPRPVFSKATYPRVDGSTATIPLSENLAAELLSLTTAEAKSFIKHNTTHNAYVNLIDGKADIIFVTEPSVDELQLAKKQGIELEIVPVVKEAFVFLVNQQNSVDVISSRQIRAIYQGLLKNWKELGGPDKAIIAYQRPDNSGSQTLMQSLVMKDLQLMPAPTELKPAEMSGLIEVIASYDNSDQAIGYSVYYYANSMYSKDTIKFVQVDGIEPNNKTISSGTYPFTSAYYAVLKKSEPVDASSRKLLAWLLSVDGQRLAESSGYVPLAMVDP